MPVIDGLPIPEAPRQVPPRAARPGTEEDPVDHRPVIGPPAALPRTGGQERPQPLPLLISQVMAFQSVKHRTDLQHQASKIHGTRPSTETSRRDRTAPGTADLAEARQLMQQGLQIISDQARYPVRHQLGEPAAGQRHHGRPRPRRQRLQPAPRQGTGPRNSATAPARCCRPAARTSRRPAWGRGTQRGPPAFAAPRQTRNTANRTSPMTRSPGSPWTSGAGRTQLPLLTCLSIGDLEHERSCRAALHRRA